MRFSIAAAAIMAGSAIATEVSTAYSTTLVTVTDCAETVTDCPAESTTIETSVVPVTTSTVFTTKVHTVTDCPPEVTDCPSHSTVYYTETEAVSTTICPVTTTTGYSNSTVAPTSTWVPPPVETETDIWTTEFPTTTEAPACPTTSVTAITKSYTTVITSVEYSTIEIPCPTSTKTSASYTPPVSSPAPPPGNTTTPVPPPTGAAGSVTGSVVFAAVAGVAAYVLA